MTDISDDDLLGLSEFGLLPENAEQAGVTGPLPAVRRVEAGGISALQWGEASPRVVFLHGGGQNAHTWDTVIVGLGVPALAVDLPGHGHSAWREDGDYSPQNNAAAIKPVIEDLAPDAELVVGMSLGGLTAIGLGAIAPQLLPELVLVDVTPSAMRRYAEMTTDQQGTVALVRVTRNSPASTRSWRSPRPRRRIATGNHCGAAFFTTPAAWTTGPGPGVTTASERFPISTACGTTSPACRCRSGWCAAGRRRSSPTRTPTNWPGVHSNSSGMQIVENSGHSVQSDQPWVLIDILRGVLAG